MDTKKRFIVPVDDELFRQGKHWAVDSDVSLAEAGRALFVALFSGDPHALAILKAASTEANDAPKRSRKGQG